MKLFACHKLSTCQRVLGLYENLDFWQGVWGLMLWNISAADKAFIVCVWGFLSTPSQTTNLDSSELKEFADNNFKFDENGKKVF